MSDVRIALPEPRPEDDEDVVWGLSTATALWSRGEIQDALVWLRRAADAANAAGQSFRASELGMYVSEIEDALTQVTVAAAPVAPPPPVTDDIDDTISEEPTNALGERGIPPAALAPPFGPPPVVHAPGASVPFVVAQPPPAPSVTRPATSWPDDEATLVRSPKTSQPPGPLAVMPPSPFETTLPSASSPFARPPDPPAAPIAHPRSAPPQPPAPPAPPPVAPPPAVAVAAPAASAPRSFPTPTPPMGSPLPGPAPVIGPTPSGAFPPPAAALAAPPPPPAPSAPVVPQPATTTLPAPAPRAAAATAPVPVAVVSAPREPSAPPLDAKPTSPVPPESEAPTTKASEPPAAATTNEPSSPPGRKERRAPILDPWAEAEPQRTPGFLTRREQKGAELTADGESVLVSVRAWRSSEADDDVFTSAKPLDSLEQKRKSGKAKSADAKPPPPPPPKSAAQPSRPAPDGARPAPPPPPPAPRSAPSAPAEARPKPPPPTPSARPAAKPAEPKLPGKLGGSNDGLAPKVATGEVASEPAPSEALPPTAPATDVAAATFEPTPTGRAPSPPPPPPASPSPPAAAPQTPPPEAVPAPAAAAPAPNAAPPPPAARPASVAPPPATAPSPAPTVASAAPSHAPRRRLPSEPEIPAEARSVAGVVLDRIDAFTDLPQEVQMRLAREARIERLAAEEEVSSFGAALVVDGEGHVCATIVDAPAHHARAGSIVPTQGSLGDGVALRVVAAKSGATVAVWEADVVDDALKACPWVSDDLRDRADKLQALAGATLGPLGDLDEAYRQQIVERLAVRVVAAHEVLIRQGEHGMGFFVVGAGEVEICEGEPATSTGEAGPGDVLFARQVIAGSPAPATARAGAAGAVVLVGDRRITQELLVTVPALLELLG